MLKYIDDIFESLYGSKYNSDGIAWSTYYSYEIKEMDNDYHSYIDIIAFVDILTTFSKKSPTSKRSESGG